MKMHHLRAENVQIFFSIRTLIDFGGIAILHAYQSRISEYVAEKELSVMNVDAEKPV